MLRIIVLLTLIFSSGVIHGQNDSSGYHSGFINLQSAQTISVKSCAVAIGFCFDDVAGDNGGSENIFGFRNILNAKIGVEYGLINNLNLGLSFSSGNQLKNIIGGSVKYQLLKQELKIPLSVSAYGSIGISLMDTSENLRDLNSFQSFENRITYYGSIIVERKFGSLLTLSVNPGFLHRNYVLFEDENGNFSIGAAARISISHKVHLIAEYNKLLSNYRKDNKDFSDHLALALQLVGSNHVIKLSLSNSIGLTDGEFIPYTRRSWSDGAFRLGFTLTGLCN